MPGSGDKAGLRMETKKILIFLASLVALLAAIAAGAGLLLSVNSAPFEFTTVRGQTAQIYGGGIYQFDTLFSAAGYRGQDATALFLGISLLVVAIFFYQRGSLRGQLLLSGMLGYFLYLYVSMALGAAFNSLFLLYIAIFSTSLFAYILSFVNIDWQRLSDRLPVLPRRSLAGFMVASGLITLFVWGLPLAAALFSGRPPDRLDSYTTMVTYALDLAIITPATFLCAYLVLRDLPPGYAIACPLLVLIVLLVPQIILSTYFQRSAGVPFTTGEMVGPVVGFVILGIIAVWLLASLLKRI
jgi:hypothetical protein